MNKSKVPYEDINIKNTSQYKLEYKKNLTHKNYSAVIRRKDKPLFQNIKLSCEIINYTTEQIFFSPIFWKHFHTNSNSNQSLNQWLLEPQKKIRQLNQARLDAENMHLSSDRQILILTSKVQQKRIIKWNIIYYNLLK